MTILHLLNQLRPQLLWYIAVGSNLESNGLLGSVNMLEMIDASKGNSNATIIMQTGLRLNYIKSITALLLLLKIILVKAVFRVKIFLTVHL